MRIFTFGVLTVTCVAAVIFSTTAARAFFYVPDAELPGPPTQAVATDPARAPQRLRIPSLQIDTTIQHVGVNKNGNMGTPSNFTDVAWYKYGPAPGDSGSAVIAGHVDNALSLSGVFKDLNQIEVGDRVYVEDATGRELVFEVTSVRTYPYDDVPTEILFNASGTRRLNLITCEGTWLKDKKTYDQRLVVFTRLVE